MTDYKTDVNKKNIVEKAKKVDEILHEAKKYKTVALIDLTKLPDALLQKVRKDIRDGKGKIIIARKPVAERVLGKMKLQKMEEYCNKPIAFILTNQSPYELNKFFRENKRKRAAKSGEKAPFEIIVPAGDTDLPPGPALSELKAGGINVQIKAGKIVVSKDSVVAKKDEVITNEKVKALQKLNVMPFETSVTFLFGYDGEYIYKKDVLDVDVTLNEDLKYAYRDSFNLSMNAKYPTAANIDMLLSNAYLESVNISLNGKLYSSVSIEQLLAAASLQGLALEQIAPKEERKND
ncbi:MAG: 50S ribosomal protein L10 [Candidatus Micrarchaeota archaeon]